MNAATWIAVASLATTLAYAAARALSLRRPSVLTLPILTTAASIVVVLLVGKIDVGAYARAARPLSWLLGPATVALAVPLHRDRALLRRNAKTIFVATPLGALLGIASAVLLSRALGLPRSVLLSLAPKSVTTPIAMPIAERLGGLPALTAAVVVLTGVLGLAVGGPLLTRAGIRRPLSRGLALGTSAHAVGTVRALSESAETGTASAVAMVIAGIVTALAAGPLVRLLS
jgi:predicted murein hydrolase (TIGR00659 family)